MGPSVFLLFKLLISLLFIWNGHSSLYSWPAPDSYAPILTLFSFSRLHIQEIWPIYPFLKRQAWWKGMYPSTWTFSAILCWSLRGAFKISETMQQSLSYLLRPFLLMWTVSEELQMEVTELQSDSQLQNKFRALPLLDFYRCVPADRCAKICKQAQVMMSLFGSTNLCEQAFSLMNLN